MLRVVVLRLKCPPPEALPAPEESPKGVEKLAGGLALPGWIRLPPTRIPVPFTSDEEARRS
jgi:hypothetical protein